MQETSLSSRELEILSSISKGFSNKEISRQKVISVNTVKYHLKNAYQKLHIKNRVEAAGWYKDNYSE